MTTKTISGSYSAGYTLQPSVTTLSITSSGYVGGYGVVAQSRSASDTVVNYGTVQGYKRPSIMSTGVYCNGLVVNGSSAHTSAYIEGAYHGVIAQRLDNFGTIVGAYLQVGMSTGVSAAYVVNGSSSDTSALIDGKSGYGVDLGGSSNVAPFTLTNFGTIIGSRVGVNDHTVMGAAVTNGAVNDTRAQIAGSVDFLVPGAVANFGTIIGSQALAGEAINIGGGYMGRYAGPARVTNGSASDMVAQIDGWVSFDYGSLSNYGTISLTKVNTTYAAVSAYGTQAFMTNFGTIEGSRANHNDGVSFHAVGTLTNGSTTDHQALVYGYIGVVLQGAGTVTNFGTIAGAGGDAVLFSSTADTLVVEAASAFIGAAVGGGGTLELVNGSGTITDASGGGWVVSGDMSPSTLTGFGTLDIASGAQFAVSQDFAVVRGQTFDLAGTLTGAGTLLLDGGTTNVNPGANLTVAKVSVGSASVNVGAMHLIYGGVWTQGLGTLAVAAGGVMVFTGGSNSFTGTLTGAGLIDFAAGADAFNHMTLGGKTEVTGTATVTLAGLTTLLTGGTLFATAPTLMVAGAVLAGGGRLCLGAASEIKGTAVSARLVNESDIIYGGGVLGGGRLVLVNDASGTIEGDLATALTIDTGANAIVNAGLIKAVGAGGVVIQSAIRNTGTLFADGGNLTVNGAVSGGGVVRIIAATADFTGAFAENVTFGATGELELANSQAYTGTIAGFSKTGATSLDLGDIAFGASTTAIFSGTTTSGVLTVTDGTRAARIKLLGNYTCSTFSVSSDGRGGTLVVDPSTTAAPHAFIAAMAGLGLAAGSIAVQPHWTPPVAALASPKNAFS